ncbi:MAG TPA: AMP-binding protein, partial [Chryseolinea sp.]|nr:AMP-binding protein [Chryseolinea sp.]
MNSTLPEVNAYQTLVAASVKWPDIIAIMDEYGSITFSELFNQTEQLKNNLIDLGIKSGHGIGLLIKNNRYFLIGLYAGIGCGAVVMPISPQQKPDEINIATREAKLHYLLSDRFDLYINEKKSIKELTVFDNPLFLGFTTLPLEEKTVTFIEHPAVMRFTSGTTG